MRRSKHASVIESLLAEGPKRYNELKRLSGLRDAQLQRALATLMREQKVIKILTEAGAPAYALNQPEHRFLTFLQHYMKNKAVINGAYVKIFIRKELYDLLKPYLNNAKDWDIVSVLEIIIEGEKEDVSQVLAKKGPLERVAYYLKCAQSELESYVSEKMIEKVINELPAGERSLFEMYEREKEYHNFLSIRLDYTTEEPEFVKVKKEEEIKEALERELKKLEIYNQIASEQGSDIVEKIKTWFINAPSNLAMGFNFVVKTTGIRYIPLTSKEMMEFNKLEGARKVWEKIVDRINDLVETMTDDLLLMVSKEPFEIIEYKEKIPAVMKDLSGEELDKIVDLLSRFEYRRAVAEVLNFLNIWPEEGPMYTKFEELVFISLVEELAKRKYELSKSARRKLESLLALAQAFRERRKAV